MKKRAIISILLLSLVFSGCHSQEPPVSVHTTTAQSEYHTDDTENTCTDGVDIGVDFEFSVIAEQIIIEHVLTNDAVICVPDTINGYPVTELAKTSLYQRRCVAVYLPDTIKSIGNAAFYRCYYLEEIVIPSSTEHIGTNPFFRCSSLTDIYVEPGNGNYCDIDGVLYNAEKTALIAYPEGRTKKSYEIPDGVTTICVDAFGYHPLVENIIIPESVVHFPDYNAFAYLPKIYLTVVAGSAADRYAKQYGINTNLVMPDASN